MKDLWGSLLVKRRVFSDAEMTFSEERAELMTEEHGINTNLRSRDLFSYWYHHQSFMDKDAAEAICPLYTITIDSETDPLYSTIVKS